MKRSHGRKQKQPAGTASPPIEATNGGHLGHKAPFKVSFVPDPASSRFSHSGPVWVNRPLVLVRTKTVRLVQTSPTDVRRSLALNSGRTGLLHPVLRLRCFLGLPLHVARRIATAVLQSLNVVNHVTRASAGTTAG